MRVAITHYVPGLILRQMINQNSFNRAGHLPDSITKLERTICNSTGVRHVPETPLGDEWTIMEKHSHTDNEAHCAKVTHSSQETYTFISV